MRPAFQQLRLDRAELLRRRRQYIEEYARIMTKLKFRERVVRELLRAPGGGAVDVEAAAGMMQVLRHRMTRQGWKPRGGRDQRVVGQIALVDELQVQIDNAQVFFFAFQFSVYARAVVHIQKIWRACVCRPPFRVMVRESRVSLGYVFLVVHRLPALQPKLRRRIEKHKHDLFLRRRKASFVISVSMKRHLRVMMTLRWTHACLDRRIVDHKKRVVTAGYLQRWWKQYLEAAAIKKKALAYSAHLRAQEAARQRSAQDQREHEASKVLQEWSTHVMIQKHKYASRVFSSLHQRMRDSIEAVDLRDPWQSTHLLGRLVDEDVERQLQRHLHHVRMLEKVVKTRKGKSRARGRARVMQEGDVPIRAPGGDSESIVLDADEFEDEAPGGKLPPTVLPYTGLFPNLDPDRVLNASELCGSTWSFWLGIERLNVQLWTPELRREDQELSEMAKTFIRWYIGESDPIVADSTSDARLSKHPYLAPLKTLYKFNTVPVQPSAPHSASAVSFRRQGQAEHQKNDPNALNHFRWFPPEMLCPKCFVFLAGSRTPEGYCTRCGLAPHHARTGRYASKLGNRYHLTTSATSIRIDVDLFLVHVIFRAISLRAHYAGRTDAVPLFDAWVQALDESAPIIAKLHQYGCTKLAQLDQVPLASIGIRGRTVLLIRSVLWHVDKVLKWIKARSPYEMTMHSPPRALSESLADACDGDVGELEPRQKNINRRKGARRKAGGKGTRVVKEKTGKTHTKTLGLVRVHRTARPGAAASGRSASRYRRPRTAPNYRL